MTQIGDILAKLGRGELITIEEQQRIRLWGNQVDYNNAYIAGLQSGMSSISASTIYGSTFFVGKEQFSGLVGKFSNDGETIPNDTITLANLDTTIYNDGYPFDGSSVTIPVSGFYNITMEVVFNDSVSQSNRRIASTSNYIYVLATALAGENMTLSGSTDVELSTGDNIAVRLWQDSGGDLSTLRSSMTIRKTR